MAKFHNANKLKKKKKIDYKLQGNSINPQFNLLSHFPNIGQEVELEIGSPTKRQCTDTTSHLNIKALCSWCFSRCKH